MEYSKKLKDPRWQKKRLEIMSRDNFKCVKCGDSTTTLNVHHEQYNGEPWECENENLNTICEHCHSLIHNLEKKDIKDYKIIDKTLYNNSDFCHVIMTPEETLLIENVKEGFVICNNDVKTIYETLIKKGYLKL